MSCEIQKTVNNLQAGVIPDFLTGLEIYSTNKDDSVVSVACLVFFTKHVVSTYRDMYGNGSRPNFQVTYSSGEATVTDRLKVEVKQLVESGIEPVVMFKTYAKEAGCASTSITKISSAIKSSARNT